MQTTVLDPRDDEASRAARRIGLIVWTVLAGLSIVPALVVAMTAVFLFDSPDSGENDIVWVLAYGLGAAPIASILTLVLSIVALVRKTRVWTLAAFAPPILWLVYMAVAVVALETICGGKFSC